MDWVEWQKRWFDMFGDDRSDLMNNDLYLHTALEYGTIPGILPGFGMFKIGRFPDFGILMVL
jgi:hypothetical protein